MSAERNTPAKKVLIIDDDQAMRMMMGMILEVEGYQVREAGDGLEGLDEVAIQMPDLILLDLRMPKMNGREFGQAFRARYGNKVPIVVVTANEDMLKGISDIEPAACLYKPFELATLVEIVEYHCNGARSPQSTRFAGL